MTMHVHDLQRELRERLLRAGIAPRHVRRYLRELEDHLADLQAEESTAGRSPGAAEAAALLRLGDITALTEAMTSQPHLQAWSARAPWVVFSLAPLVALAAAYFVACLILSSGWSLFLPGSSTPFVPVHGPAVLYFGLGRLLYYAAPTAIGWGVGLLAARQRTKALWPAFALILLAWISGAAQVHASHPLVPGKAGQISMGLHLVPFAPGASSALPHALLFLLLTALPYLLWRFRLARSLVA